MEETVEIRTDGQPELQSESQGCEMASTTTHTPAGTGEHPKMVPLEMQVPDTTASNGVAEAGAGGDKEMPIDGEKPGESSVLGASANMYNTIVAVGIITLPRAMLISGIWSGIFLALLCGFLSYWTSILMVKTGRKVGKYSYGELCMHTLGKKGFYSITSMIIMLMFGAMTAYLIIFRQTMSGVIQEYSDGNFSSSHAKLVLVGVAVLLLPLCCLRNVSKLSWTSILGFCAVTGIIVVMFVRAPVYADKMKNLDKGQMRDIANGDKLNEEFGEYVLEHYSESDHYKNLTETQGALKTKILSHKDAPKNLKQSLSPEERDAFLTLFSDELYKKWKINEGTNGSNFNKFQFIKAGFLAGIGALVAGHVSQQSVFPIYKSLRVKTERNWKLTMSISMIAVVVSNMTVAVFGYFTFLDQTQGTILQNLNARYLGMELDHASNIANILLALSVALTYVMQLFYARVNIAVVMKLKPDELTRSQHLGITFGLWGCTLLVAIFVDEIFTVVSLIGALFCGPIVFLLPVACFCQTEGGLRCTLKKGLGGDVGTFMNFTFLPVLVLSFGMIITVLGPVMCVLDTVGVEI